MKKPELMSPVKDWASLQACKDYADAVYFGASDLSLRANANAIKLSEVGKFVKKCHSYNIKAYQTLNSAIYNPDIKKAEKIIENAKKAKVDALIVWDPAIIELAKKHKVNFFISTQANISNSMSAKFYQKLGAKRIVLAREMTLKQIKELRKSTNIEIETFIHGAMCVAISGRCILSAYLYGKSSNRGSCAQPCRKEWILSDEEGKQISNQGKYFMNAKDLCMIEYIPDLIKAGINSFKIEGRKRDLKYIQITSKCYREAIDSYFDKTFTKEKIKKWKQQLESVYNRGFSTGFYFGEPSKEGINYQMANNASKRKRILIGTITHYYPKAKAASLYLKHRGLKLKENITIEGKTTFLEEEIKSMQIEGKDVKRGKKGEEVAIKLSQRARQNDKVFIVIDK